MMQTAEHWNECWHCNPKKFAQAYSPQDCPCKCHVSPTPDSMDETDPQWLKDNGFPELSKALEAIQHHSPTPTDNWVDDFNKKFILNQQDPLRLTSPSWQEWKEIKSFISQVRQKAYSDGRADLLSEIQDEQNKFLQGFAYKPNCSCYCHKAKNGETYTTSGCIHCKGYEIK